MGKVVEALKHIHAHGVIHNDIKMENIVLSKDKSDVALIDFGLAVKVTEMDQVCAEDGGSRRFFPPEHYPPEPYHGRGHLRYIVLNMPIWIRIRSAVLLFTANAVGP